MASTMPIVYLNSSDDEPDYYTEKNRSHTTSNGPDPVSPSSGNQIDIDEPEQEGPQEIDDVGLGGDIPEDQDSTGGFTHNDDIPEFDQISSEPESEIYYSPATELDTRAGSERPERNYIDIGREESSTPAITSVHSSSVSAVNTPSRSYTNSSLAHESIPPTPSPSTFGDSDFSDKDKTNGDTSFQISPGANSSRDESPVGYASAASKIREKDAGLASVAGLRKRAQERFRDQNDESTKRRNTEAQRQSGSRLEGLFPSNHGPRFKPVEPTPRHPRKEPASDDVEVIVLSDSDDEVSQDPSPEIREINSGIVQGSNNIEGQRPLRPIAPQPHNDRNQHQHQHQHQHQPQYQHQHQHQHQREHIPKLAEVDDSDDDLVIVDPTEVSSKVHFKPTSFRSPVQPQRTQTQFDQPAPGQYISDPGYNAARIGEEQLRRKYLGYVNEINEAYAVKQRIDHEIAEFRNKINQVTATIMGYKNRLTSTYIAPEVSETYKKALFTTELELQRYGRLLSDRITASNGNVHKIKSLEQGLQAIRSQFHLQQQRSHQNPYMVQYDQMQPSFFQQDLPMAPMSPIRFGIGNTGEDDADLQNLLDNIRPDEELEDGLEQTPPELSINLMKHQRIGLAWLKRMEESKSKGGILADDMGLGKTIQAIALIVTNRPKEDDNKTTLIIAPVSLLRQWAREIESKLKSSRSLKVAIYHGSDKKMLSTFKRVNKYDVLLTSYGTLSSEWKRHFKEALQEIHANKEAGSKNTAMPNFEDGGKSYVSPFFSKDSNFFRIILDEAQNIKNKSSLTSKSVYYLKGDYRLCLSGTPMQNNVDELYPILRFLKIRPYNNELKFRHDISLPMKSNSEDKYDDTDKNSSIRKLRALLKAILLRRMKTSLIDGKPIFTLPEKHVLADYVDMNKQEKEYYDSLESQIQKKAEKLLNTKHRSSATSILTLLLRLRQACCHWFLVEIGEIKASQSKNIDDELNKPKDWRKMYSQVKALDQRIIRKIKVLADDEEGNGSSSAKIEELDDAFALTNTNEEEKKLDLLDTFMDPLKDEEEEINVGRSESRLKEQEDMLTCPVCYTVLTPSDSITILPKCGHMICHSCIDIFFEDNSVDEDNSSSKVAKCVECLTKVKQDDLIDYEIFKKVHNHGFDYNQVREFCKKYYSSSNIPKNNVLIADLIKKENGYTASAKIQKAMDLVDEIFTTKPEEKIIIFSQFTVLFDVMKLTLDEKNINFLRYDGSMSLEAKNNTILKFYDPEANIKVLLLSLKAGNTGLTLTCASHVIIMDPFWNPFVEEQAMDRAYRIGQEREVFVHRILISGTVESRIIELQDMKKELVGSALDEKGMKSVSRLGQKELGFLFGLNKLS